MRMRLITNRKEYCSPNWNEQRKVGSMAHFYAEIQGNRGEATRMGTKESGVLGHIRGWSVGAKVVCIYDDLSGKDIVRVFRTGGSNNSSGELVTEFCDKPNVLANCCNGCVSRFQCFTERK